VYCQQPAGFIDPDKPNHVCLLVKSLYGLRQAPHACYQQFAGHLRTMGFTSTVSDSSLFVYKRRSNMAWLLLYVNDIVLTASSAKLLQDIIRRLHAEFSMKDLGLLH
jgi:hypothetical protein